MFWPVNRKRKKSWHCSSRSKTKRMTTMTDMMRAKISWTQLAKVMRLTK